MPKVYVFVPAHNEQAGIAHTLTALQQQTVPPHHITVVADNCTDRTAEIAAGFDVEVFTTTGNTHKKAGALNQALARALPDIADEDYVFVQDADSVLESDFLANAARHLTRDEKLGAVAGTFRAQPPVTTPPRGKSRLRKAFTALGNLNARILRHLQDNEFARYARDVRRLKGRCLVVTGTAAMFRAATLKELSQARLAEKIPVGDGRGGIYDPLVLTEDNELSFAIMHLGYKLLAPPDCLLTTEAMPTWKQLWRQRLRWKRGAVENCVQYGWTKITRPYWGRQIITMVGVVVTMLYLVTLVVAFGTHSIRVQPFWLSITGIFVLERFITLKDKGFKFRLAAATMYELPYEFFLQATHAKAYLDSLTRTERKW